MADKKYASLNTLQIFFNNLKNIFATKDSVAQKSQVQIITWEADD